MSEDMRGGATRPRDARNWDVGIDDARTGQNWMEYRNALEYEDERQRIEQTRELEKEIARVEAQLDQTVEDIRLAEEQRAADEPSCNAAENDRRLNGSDYSRSIGWLFVAIAALLVVVDVPLAMLAANGLGLESPWERAAVGAGFALLALFFKIPLDPLMRRTYLLPRYARMICTALQIIVVAGVAVYLAVNFWMLAEVRSQLLVYNGQVAELELKKNQGQLDQAEADQRLAAIATQQNVVNRSARNSLLGIAVVLPLAAAIFASAGSARLGNASRFKDLMARRTAALARIDALRTSAADHEGRLAALHADLWAEQSLSGLSAGRYAHYLHGYERGYADEEPTDLQPGALALRVRKRLTRWMTIADRRQNEILTARISREGRNG